VPSLKIYDALKAALAVAVTSIVSAAATKAGAANTVIPAKYVGKWHGISATWSLQEAGTTGTAATTTDLGSETKRFSFVVAPDGKITGKGNAVCWFDVTCNANLIAVKQKLEAHLVPSKSVFSFTIAGEMTSEGAIRLESATTQRMTLLNAGKRNDQWEPYTVFGYGTHPIKEEDCQFVLDVSQTLPRGIKMAWTAVKFKSDYCGKLAEEIWYLGHQYMPHSDLMIATYKEAKKNEDVLAMSTSEMQDWVLAKVKETDPEATISEEATQEARGKATVKISDCTAPYLYICNWTEEHGNYHVLNHFQKEDKMEQTLRHQELVKWWADNEIETYNNVNLRKAREKLDELKKDCRKKCATECCGD